MGAQLNIKDAQVFAAARELARDLGKSVTDTIGEAIEEKRLHTVAQRGKLYGEVMSLLEESARLWSKRTRGMTARQHRTPSRRAEFRRLLRICPVESDRRTAAVHGQ